MRQCPDGVERVLDPLRGKWVALTPEEWVRQHFVAHLTENLGYPAALMGNEVPLTLNGTSRRCDTVLFSSEGLRPVMIVEYKAPHVEITAGVRPDCALQHGVACPLAHRIQRFAPFLLRG